MKTTITLAFLAFLSLVAAQSETPAKPSPTESVGCEPHGHCDGPISTSVTLVSGTSVPASTTSAATEVHDHDDEEEEHDHEHEEEEHTDASGTGTLAPSPTESVGCEPHGDHWHCDSAATATAVVTTDAAGTGTLAPSPTASVGCEPHGDHWHCDGPATSSLTSVAANRTIAVSTSSEAASTSTPTQVPANGAAVLTAKLAALMGLAGLVAAFAL